jgi:IPT/TIG domain
MKKIMRSSNIGKHFAGCLLSFVCLLVFFTGNLSGATIFVGPPPASIQDAIDSASDGDTIQLSAGTYIEEVNVTSMNLNIVGAGINNTTIQALDPSTHLTQNFTFGAANFWCIVMVDNQAAPISQTVNISDLTVDGGDQQDTLTSPFYSNSDRFFAIGYHNASGTVQNVHTTNTRQLSNFNELAGGGIICAADTGTYTCNVTNCLIDFYQRSGIDCRGAALTANILNSTVNRGYSLTPNTITATPNGIQFSVSTTGSIVNNIVTGNIATVFDASASGIIPFGAGPNLIVSGNTIDTNDNGIAAVECGNNLTISNNTLNFTGTPGVNIDEGIIVQDTDGLTTISSNVMNNIPDINMDLSSTANQTFQLMDNQFNGSQTGLLVTGDTTVGPVITMNNDSFTGTSGYYIQEVTAPNDIWPSTATVTFDGLLSGYITMAQFNYILTKIYDQHNDPTLGLVLDFITPSSPILANIDTTSGPTTGGNAVTITGTGFISSNTAVNFGTASATSVVVVSDTTIIAIAPPGTGTVDVSVVTPFGTTPIVPADEYTYLLGPPLPPSNFTGVIKTEFNQSNYILISHWDASPSPDVVLYRIYNNTTLVDEILVGFPLRSYACLDSKLSAIQFNVVAVSSDNEESTPVPITIVQE